MARLMAFTSALALVMAALLWGTTASADLHQEGTILLSRWSRSSHYLCATALLYLRMFCWLWECFGHSVHGFSLLCDDGVGVVHACRARAPAVQGGIAGQ